MSKIQFLSKIHFLVQNPIFVKNPFSCPKSNVWSKDLIWVTNPFFGQKSYFLSTIIPDFGQKLKSLNDRRVIEGLIYSYLHDKAWPVENGPIAGFLCPNSALPKNDFPAPVWPTNITVFRSLFTLTGGIVSGSGTLHEFCIRSCLNTISFVRPNGP